MIRTREYSPPADLLKAWKAAIKPVADAALKDFKSWPLYQHVGEPWPDAPPRFVRAASLAAVVKGRKSGETEKLMEAANPGLKAMYHNLSTLLNDRKQYLNEVWNPMQEVVWKGSRAAFTAMTKRLKWQPAKDDEGFWVYAPNSYLWPYVWDQLHRDALEAPFSEHFLTILRAGHALAGLRGDDWKTCHFLYY